MPSNCAQLIHDSYPKSLTRDLSTSDPVTDLLERDIPGEIWSLRMLWLDIDAEWAEATIISGAQLILWNISTRFDECVGDLFRSFDSWI